MNIAPTFRSKHFSWSDNKGISFITDIPGNPLSRVYDDACDVGFFVQSGITGNKRLFLLTDEDDHDTKSWIFTSECGNFTIQIFND